MRDAAGLTVQLSAAVTQRLARRAASAHRSVSELAAETIPYHVAHAAAVVAGIERGLADMAAGRLVPHDDAMARLEVTVASKPR